MAANVRSHCQRMRAPVKRCPTPARTRRRALMGQRTRAGIEQRLTDRVRSLTSVTMTGSCSRSSRLTRQMLPAETHASPPLPTMTCSSVSSMNRLPAARCHRVGDFRYFGERSYGRSRGRTFPPTAARTDACYGRPSRQEFPDRQRQYCYGCSVYRLSPGLYPETLSWALKDVLKIVDIP
jgi:hypothetical protein